MRWYDAKHNRLVYMGESTSPQFWATMWQSKRDLAKELSSDTTDPLIPSLTQRFISPGPDIRILDGGCGIGQHVARLQRLGYDAYGIDYDQATVDRIKTTAPHLQIICGDVRSLPYPNDYFTGYWSIGVIEHWAEGYDLCTAEMYRVLKSSGFLFLTFPHLSRLRQYKVRQQTYPLQPPPESSARQFYQYALDTEQVIKDLTKQGFRLRLRQQTGGLKGLKDEVSFLQPALQRLYNSPLLINKLVKVSISWALNPLSGHSAVLVFQKL